MSLLNNVTGLTLSLLSSVALTLPVTATTYPDIIVNASVPQESVANQGVILAQSTALLVTFPQDTTGGT